MLKPKKSPKSLKKVAQSGDTDFEILIRNLNGSNVRKNELSNFKNWMKLKGIVTILLIFIHNQFLKSLLNGHWLPPLLISVSFCNINIALL